MHAHYNSLAGGEAGRIAGLSDGRFAFAATALALDFHAPEAADVHLEAALSGALAVSAPRLAPWLLTLMTFGILARSADPAQPARPFEPRFCVAAFRLSRRHHRSPVLDQAARRFSDLIARPS